MDRGRDEDTPGWMQSSKGSSSRPMTAFVLAGGGSLGAIEVGMLKALTAYGVRPDLVVGSSVGAINGAHFAGSPDPAGVRRLEDLWRGLRRSGLAADGTENAGAWTPASWSASWPPNEARRSSTWRGRSVS